MSFTSKLSKSFTIALMIIGLIVTMSCENKWSVEPDGSAVAESRQVTILSTRGDRSLDKGFSATAWVTENGGRIRVGDYESGRSGLEFPAHAVDDDVQISMYWESENLLQADFYPEGIHFNQPVYIRLSYKDADLTGIDENDLAIYYYNPDTGNWDLISNNVNTALQYVGGYIHHFSRYAIGME